MYTTFSRPNISNPETLYEAIVRDIRRSIAYADDIICECFQDPQGRFLIPPEAWVPLCFFVEFEGKRYKDIFNILHGCVVDDATANTQGDRHLRLPQLFHDHKDFPYSYDDRRNNGKTDFSNGVPMLLQQLTRHWVAMDSLYLTVLQEQTDKETPHLSGILKLCYRMAVEMEVILEFLVDSVQFYKPDEKPVLHTSKFIPQFKKLWGKLKKELPSTYTPYERRVLQNEFVPNGVLPSSSRALPSSTPQSLALVARSRNHGNRGGHSRNGAGKTHNGGDDDAMSCD